MTYYSKIYTGPFTHGVLTSGTYDWGHSPLVMSYKRRSDSQGLRICVLKDTNKRKIMYSKLCCWIYRQCSESTVRRRTFGNALHLYMQYGGTPPNLTVKWKRISIIAYWWMNWRFLSTALVTQIFRPQLLMLCLSGAHGLCGTPVGCGNAGYISVSHCGRSNPTWRTILKNGTNYTLNSHTCQNMCWGW